MKLGFQNRRQRIGRVSAIAAASLVALLVLPTLASIRLAQLFDARLIVGYLGVVSTVTFFLYWSDKRNAEAGAWRTAESTLHLAELFGGWPAAFLAQRAFRHKITKRSYQAAFWVIVAMHQGASFDLLHDWHYTRATLELLQS